MSADQASDLPAPPDPLTAAVIAAITSPIVLDAIRDATALGPVTDAGNKAPKRPLHVQAEWRLVVERIGGGSQFMFERDTLDEAVDLARRFVNPGDLRWRIERRLVRPWEAWPIPKPPNEHPR